MHDGGAPFASPGRALLRGTISEPGSAFFLDLKFRSELSEQMQVVGAPWAVPADDGHV
jgi:hypothetical protein